MTEAVGPTVRINGGDDPLSHIALAPRDAPLVIPWSDAAHPGRILAFGDAHEWRAAIGALGVHPSVPWVVRGRFIRAQKLQLLGWVDADLFKPAELVAFTALELALLDRHGKRPLARQFGDLVAKRGLTAAHLSLDDGRGVLLARVAGAEKPSLAELRNQLAHGDPFGDMPTSGLLQTLRDLIDFVYAGMIKGGDGVEV